MNFDEFKREERRSIRKAAYVCIAVSVLAILACLILRTNAFAPIISLGAVGTSLCALALNVSKDPDKK